MVTAPAKLDKVPLRHLQERAGTEMSEVEPKANPNVVDASYPYDSNHRNIAYP